MKKQICCELAPFAIGFRDLKLSNFALNNGRVPTPVVKSGLILVRESSVKCLQS